MPKGVFLLVMIWQSFPKSPLFNHEIDLLHIGRLLDSKLQYLTVHPKSGVSSWRHHITPLATDYLY
jgi:hypothetical protein